MLLRSVFPDRELGATPVLVLVLLRLLRLPLLLLLMVDGATLTTIGTGANVTDLPETGLRGGLGSGETPLGGVLRTAFRGAGVIEKPDMSGCADSRR